MKRFPLLLAAGLVLLLLEATLTWAETVRFRLGPPHGHIVFKASSRQVDADGRRRGRSARAASSRSA
jgi:hypothetical protein